MTQWQGKTKVLSDEKMRELGFTDRVADTWFYSKRVGDNKLEVALTVMINKESGFWYELVEDLQFGQPFYYKNNQNYGQRIKEDIDKQLKTLNDAGLTVSIDHDEYGVS